MNTGRDSFEPGDAPDRAGFGIARDVRQLRVHGQASAEELREFLAHTRGRRPQEVLGMVAGSQLTRSIALATVGTVLVLAIGTIVPWLIGRAISDGTPPTQESAAAPTEADQANEAATAPDTSAPDAAANPTPSPADAQRAVNAMGLGDTKTADPKANPLENNLDDLLDGLD